jgi:hypothetical protein
VTILVMTGAGIAAPMMHGVVMTQIEVTEVDVGGVVVG